MGLFWRTFLYLVLLLTGCILAWVQTFRALEFEPQALQSARQVASLVNLTRAALQHADAIARVSLVKTLADEERLRIAPREPQDSYAGYGTDPFSRRVVEELTSMLGPNTVVAREVNGFSGLWVAFSMGPDSYWLLLDPHRVASIQGRTWLIWLVITALLSLTGAAVLARLINQPLQALSRATAQVRSGDWTASPLDENAATPEIRAVNQGFNRMTRQLARMETDRQLMLAGISHDLRTPLARLRLEAEMSVPDPQARDDMVADMAQVNSIIDKFLEYARPSATPLQLVDVADCVQAAIHSQRDQASACLQVHTRLPPGLMAWADPTDLQRVINNLLENARRYGQTPHPHTTESTESAEATDFARTQPPGQTEVLVSAHRQGEWVCIDVSDRGRGVDAATLARMTQPFFRGDLARSQASGAGLGLAVVKKMLERMGGQLALSSGIGNSASMQATARASHAAHPGLQGLTEFPGLHVHIQLRSENHAQASSSAQDSGFLG